MAADVHLVATLEEANAYVDWLEHKAARVLAVDTETTGIEFHDVVRTFQIGDRDEAWVIPYERGGWGALVDRTVDWITTHEPKVVMHNFKFDQQKLRKDGLVIPDHLVYDTRIMGRLLDPTRPTGLKPLADRYVKGSASRGQEDLHSIMKKNGWTWATVPVDLPEYWFYGGLDTILTARLYDVLEPQTFPQFQGIYDLEYAAQVVIRGIEERGVLIDLEYCDRKVIELQAEAADIAAVTESQFGIKNIGSNDQVIKVLIDQGWEPEAFTDGGKPSLNRHVLESVKTKFPLAADVVRYKHLLKMCGSQYLGGYAELVDKDGFIHPSINPMGARTGRMSVQRPALQTLHRDAMVRDAFIARPGHKLIFADYDQMEVRLTAAFAGDPDYKRIIAESSDVHTTTAAQVYGIAESEVSKSMRQRTKNVVYAKLYGAGIDKFAETAGISTDEAREFMTRFDATFPAVPGLINYIVGHKDHTGRRSAQGVAERRYFEEGIAYVTSPYGRRHMLNETEVYPFVSNGADWLGGPLYRLVNYLVQGTGADVLKQAIVDAARAGIDEYLVQLVHDETGWDVPEKEVEEVSHEIKKAMTMNDWKGTGVDLTVGMDICDRWGDKYAHTRGTHATDVEPHEMDDTA